MDTRYKDIVANAANGVIHPIDTVMMPGSTR
jgi:uncharacterized surface protein with fasciclin (FAS1) repeats